MSMSLSAWYMRFEQLVQVRDSRSRRANLPHTHPNTELRDWLAHQKALCALGAAWAQGIAPLQGSEGSMCTIIESGL